MNSSKPIDISKSSLVSLKAELSRKQEEVSSVKANKAGNYVCPIINPNKKPLSAENKFSKNVEKNAEDESSSVAEENTKALEHSRNILEIKSKLYDELKEGRLVSEPGRGAEYLVDFTQKTSETCESVSRREKVEKEEEKEQSVSDNDDEYDDRPSDPEDDWVNYTDVVGRERRCLRRDLAAMRARDEASLVTSHPPPSPPPPPEDGCFDTPAPALPEPAPAPPHIEAMRRQWRQQEVKLLDKNNVHYEDLLFNEARTHGVGYYAFSTDEDERSRQLLELQRRREETLQRQADAEGLRARRDAQLRARLQAAKARNRQRLGLPQEEHDQHKDDVEENADEKRTDDDSSSSKKDELEAALKRAAHIRPWDAEKLGLKIVADNQPAVMSQSEWVDMKREERISEFAPPEMYQQIRIDAKMEPAPDDLSTSLPSENKTLFFTSKRPKASDFFRKQVSSEQCQSQESSSDRLTNDDTEPVKRKRTEIPPPLTAEYFGGTGRPKHRQLPKHGGVGESISEGIKYLNEQRKVKDKKRDKGMLDII